MICEWSSSRFPQNSFSPISFIIAFYSLFHPPFHPISPPSPSSPLIPDFHSYYHPCSLCIHSHLSLLLNHFNHTHSYPFPLQSSHSIPLHHFHSFAIPFLTLHSHLFSGIIALHYQAFILFSLIPTLFIDSYHLSFLLHAADLIHLISSLLILITSLYLLSFSINLDSILCSMYYDLSISYPYLSLITLLFFYSISFYSYSYSFSPMPIHFIVSHSSIRHHTQLLMSIHSHLNTPYPLPSFILSQFYSSIHIVLSVIPFSPLHPPSLLYSLLIHPLIPILSTFSSLLHHLPITLPIHSFPHHPLSPILFSFHPSSYSISTPLSFPLLPLSFTNHSLIRFSPSILFSSLFPDSFLFPFFSCFSSPLSTTILFHTHSHTLHSVHSLLSYLSFFLLEPSSLPFLFIPIFSIFQSLLLPYHYPLPSLSY